MGSHCNDLLDSGKEYQFDTPGWQGLLEAGTSLGLRSVGSNIGWQGVNEVNSSLLISSVCPGASISLPRLAWEHRRRFIRNIRRKLGHEWFSGPNLQWGVLGATSNILGGLTGAGGTFGLPKNTLFLTQGETTLGVRATAPAEASASGQGVNNSQFIPVGTAFNGLPAAANSTVASWDTAGDWSAGNPSFNAIGFSYGIEQPGSGSNAGPTNSALDLFELKATNAGGSGSGVYLGTFSHDNSGNLNYVSAVPEPSTYAAVGVGTAFPLPFHRVRRPLTA